MDDWGLVAAELRQAEDPRQSRLVPRLYELAEALGVPLLMKRGVEREDALDLVHELLAAKLPELARATELRPFFCVCLKNLAISQERTTSREVLTDPQLHADDAERSVDDTGKLEARALLEVVQALLTERECDVLIADHEGVAREEIAAALKTSRPNIDQIVRRARLKLAKAGLP